MSASKSKKSSKRKPRKRSSFLMRAEKRKQHKKELTWAESHQWETQRLFNNILIILIEHLKDGTLSANDFFAISDLFREITFDLEKINKKKKKS